jgi:amino acid adenylation domain-containing protein
MSNKDLLAQLDKLPPAKREALLKKLKEKKLKGQQNATSKPVIPVLDRATHSHFPLSFAQQRLWFLDKLDSSTAFYNLAAAIEMDGKLDAPALQKALNYVLSRHEILRTTFSEDQGEAFQIVHAKATLNLDSINIDHLAGSAQAKELDTLKKRDAQTLFDLNTGPLLKTTLVKLNEQQHVFLLTMHHIIADGWSAQCFAQELSQAYAAFVTQQIPAMAPLSLQYADFSTWQRQWLQGEVLQKQSDYWQQHLKNAPTLHLPTDFPRPPVQTYNGKTQTVELSSEHKAGLNQLAQQQQGTLYMAMLTVFYVFLHRYSQQDDLVVGTPVANRTRTELEPLIGFFVNTLAVRAQLKGDSSFLDLLKQVKEATIGAQSNQDLPFERLVELLELDRDPSYSPLFQTFFSLDKGALAQSIQLPGVSATFKPADIDAAKFDLSLICTEHENGIRCVFEYNTDLFDDATIKQMSQHLLSLVDSILNTPEQAVATLPILSGAEQQQLVHEWNQTDAEVPALRDNLCLHQLIEQQVERSPDAIALRHGEQAISYQTLNQQANQLAAYLREQGLRPGARVGVCLPPSIDAMLAILATLKAGGAYVPMDVSYPAERLQHMADNAEMTILLTHSEFSPQFQQIEHIIQLDTDASNWSACSKDNLLNLNTPDDLLYVVYTSGSTGLPKGACVHHRNELNLLHWYTKNYQMSANDKALVISALGFDLTQKNLFALLTLGGTVVFPTSRIYDPKHIQELINHHQITLMNCAPSAFYPLVEHNITDYSAAYACLSSLRCVLFGGEPIHLATLKGWLHQSRCQLVNMYGPTECTDIAASYTLQSSDLDEGKWQSGTSQSGLPIGRPNSNVKLYVLDEHFQQVVPLGVPGELCIGGAGVGSGYLNNPEMSNKVFIDSPFGQAGSNEKLYRTGDLVRYRRDGNLEFISRIDGQVKIRGFRIELGEIEALLKAQDSIKYAVVADKKAPNGQTVLVAYLIEQESETRDQNTLRAMLKQHLPDYMVPSAYLSIAEIPLTPNGKIDRKILPSPDIKDLGNAEYTPARDEVEQALCQILADVLKLEQVGIYDNFFEIGGHSLLATQIISRIADRFQLDLPVRTIFEIPTVIAQADLIRSLSPSSLTTADATDYNNEDEDEFEEGIL